MDCLSQEESYLVHQVFLKKQICTSSVTLPPFLSKQSVYYCILQNEWSALLSSQNWELFIDYVDIVSLHPNTPIEYQPSDISVPALPFCLSLPYVLVMLLKMNECEKVTSLWNAISHCRSDLCQTL